MARGRLSVLLACVFVLGCVGQAMAAYTLDYFFVQHRVYEDGRDFNRIAFAIKNGKGLYVTTNQLKSITLTDPKGQVVPLSKADLKFDAYNELDGGYDGSNGVFLYGTPYQSSNYYGVVPGKLIPGTYHLSVKYGTSVCQMDYIFYRLVKLPITKASSIVSSVDKSGNLTIQWGVPMSLCSTNPTLPTSVRAFIDAYQDDAYKATLNVRIPTHMGRLFVPKLLVDKLKSQGNKYSLMIQLRTNDNNNRTYSNAKSISLSSGSQELSVEVPSLEGKAEK